MKAKNIMMSILLVIGSIAAKAAGGYPPELALVSQPVMVYNYNSITVYYDVENIGDYTYRGYVSLFLDPDYGYSYAEKYVKVYPGRIKRIAIDIPLNRIDRRFAFTIMPYYELGDELYSFTTFEYFEPLGFYWNGPRNERWVVITVPPRIRHYHRPGTYRYYYDGFRPPMPPPGYGPGMPPPMDPKHHTYGYHHNNGGYPATHPDVSNGPANTNEAPKATVRPKTNGGSMSSGNANSGGSNASTVKPSTNNGSSSGRVNSGSTSRPSSGTSTRPVINSGSNSRPSSGTSNSGSSRVNNGSSNSRSSGSSSSSSSRVNNGSSSRSNNSSSTRSSSSSSSTRSSGSCSSSSRSSSNSRSGSSSGRR